MGTSVDKHIVILIQQDHPHAYGDKLSGAFFQANFLGSSPRVWGQVLSSLRDFLPYRIIPMRMGTRTLYLSADVVIKDHPHAYGDKYNVGGTTPSKKGSSPRVWGQVLKKYSDAIINRIIPTRMGTRGHWSKMPKTVEDHPHAYGDKGCNSCGCNNI